MAQSDYAAAFVRYLKQAIQDLAAPVEKALADQGAPAAGEEAIAGALLEIAKYLVRGIGSVSQPEIRFWSAVVDFFSHELGLDTLTTTRSREDFQSLVAHGPPSAFALTRRLRVLGALREYDHKYRSDFTDQMRMFLWRFASAFIASDDEVDPHGEDILAELKRILHGETTSTLGEAENVDLGLFRQLQRTIGEIKDPLHSIMRMGWTEGEDVPTGDRLLVQSLHRILIHFLLEIGKVDEDEVRFYRDFSRFFELTDGDPPSQDDMGYWRGLLDHYLREQAPIFRELNFPSVECLAMYDRAHGTEHAEQCRTMDDSAPQPRWNLKRTLWILGAVLFVTWLLSTASRQKLRPSSVELPSSATATASSTPNVGREVPSMPAEAVPLRALPVQPPAKPSAVPVESKVEVPAAAKGRLLFAPAPFAPDERAGSQGAAEADIALSLIKAAQ